MHPCILLCACIHLLSLVALRGSHDASIHSPMWFPTLIWSNELCVLQVALAELLTVHLPPARPRRGGPDLGGRDRGLLVELCVRPLPPPHALPAYRPPRPFLPQPAQDSDSFTHHATMLGLYIFTIVLVAACMLQWGETLDNDVELPFPRQRRGTAVPHRALLHAHRGPRPSTPAPPDDPGLCYLFCSGHACPPRSQGYASSS